MVTSPTVLLSRDVILREIPMRKQSRIFKMLSGYILKTIYFNYLLAIAVKTLSKQFNDFNFRFDIKVGCGTAHQYPLRRTEGRILIRHGSIYLQ